MCLKALEILIRKASAPRERQASLLRLLLAARFGTAKQISFELENLALIQLRMEQNAWFYDTQALEVIAVPSAGFDGVNSLVRGRRDW